jgi:hypothetical protein
VGWRSRAARGWNGRREAAARSRPGGQMGGLARIVAATLATICIKPPYSVPLLCVRTLRTASGGASTSAETRSSTARTSPAFAIARGATTRKRTQKMGAGCTELAHSRRGERDARGVRTREQPGGRGGRIFRRAWRGGAGLGSAARLSRARGDILHPLARLRVCTSAPGICLSTKRFLRSVLRLASAAAPAAPAARGRLYPPFPACCSRSTPRSLGRNGRLSRPPGDGKGNPLR